MRRHLHAWIGLLFFLVLAYDFVVWGGAARLPEVGTHLQDSARREGPLAYFYMQVGSAIDGAVPALDSWGQRRAEVALAEGFPRIKDDPAVSMDLVFSQTWNIHHATLKFCHWAAPVLAVLALVFWMRRPKKVRLMGSRRG